MRRKGAGRHPTTASENRNRRAKGIVLRKIREDLHLSENEAARRSQSLDVGRISRLEHGLRPIRSSDMIALSNAYEIPVREIQKRLGDHQLDMFWEMVASLRQQFEVLPKISQQEAHALAAFLQTYRLQL